MRENRRNLFVPATHFHNIAGVHHGECACWRKVEEGGKMPCGFACLPLYLEYLKCPILFRKEIEFLLIVSAPEKQVLSLCSVDVLFPVVADEEVFQKRAPVAAQMEIRERIHDGVPNAKIHEIDFHFPANRGAQVTGKSVEPKENKRFFEEINVPFDGFRIHAELRGKFAVRDFVPDLEREELQEFP